MGKEFNESQLIVKKESAMYPGADRNKNRNILMNNRMGIRLEFDIDLGDLELWINPRAGRSLSYKDVNFSCRDDYTTIFDKITMPYLNPVKFERCEYDAFCTTLYFEEQKISFLSLIDKPVIILHFAKKETVDFKTDKADSIGERSEQLFVTNHPDRWNRFNFVAGLTGGATYRHQPAIDDGRSIYARAQIVDDSMIILSGGIDGEDDTLALVKEFQGRSFEDIKKENDAKIEKSADCAKIRIKGNEKLENLLEINKRTLISMQNESGAIQAAIKRIYYLIWIRDAGMIWSLCSYAGMTWPLDKWTEFMLANPTETNERGMTGKMFGQMANGKLSKWQEDGPFYAVWSAFTHWTQTGDEKYRSNEHTSVLEECVEWLERYCLNKENGLFGRYFACETPLTNSRDYQWDTTVGKATDQTEFIYKDKVITRSYDVYVNGYMHSVYMMLAALEMENNPESAKKNLEKAKALGEAMDFMFDGDGLPKYGLAEDIDGNLIECEPYGMDDCDYQWAMALAMFMKDPLTMNKHRNQVCSDMMSRKGHFVAGYASVLTGMDTEFINEDKIWDAINYVAEQSYRPGDYLCMPNTIIEYLDIDDGNIFHDVRPQGFSISAMLSATVNLGIKKLPFSIAVRANKNLAGVDSYEYQGRKIDFVFEGEGAISKIIAGDKVLENTWVIPKAALADKITVQMDAAAKTTDTLIYTSCDLLTAENGCFEANGYGINQFLFKNLTKEIRVLGENGELKVDTVKDGDYTLISFEGVEKIKIEMI